MAGMIGMPGFEAHIGTGIANGDIDLCAVLVGTVHKADVDPTLQRFSAALDDLHPAQVAGLHGLLTQLYARTVDHRQQTAGAV